MCIHRKTRRERLKNSRGYTDEKIDAIFDSQSKEEDFFKKFKKLYIMMVI